MPAASKSPTCSSLSLAVATGCFTMLCCALPDALLLNWLGERTPPGLSALVVGFYLLLGAAAGVLLRIGQSCWTRIRPCPAENSLTAAQSIAGLLRGHLIIVAGICIFIFMERLYSGGARQLQVGYHAFSLAALIVSGLTGMAFCRPARESQPPGWLLHGWRCVVMIAGAAAWFHVHRAYEAPMLSATSLVMQGGFAVAVLLIYLAGVAVLRPSATTMSSEPSRPIGAWVRVAAMIVVVVVAGESTRWLTLLRPIDHLADRSAEVQPKNLAPGAPNVILIVMDTSRADHLSLYGYDRRTSPFLETFAKHGTLYMQAIAPATWTLPSHASLFTGLYPTEHGAHYEPTEEAWRARPLAPQWNTLAEVLQARGYATAAVIGNSYVVGREFGFEQGFDYFDDTHRNELDAFEIDTLVPSRWPYAAYAYLTRATRFHYRYADQINRDVERVADRLQGRPFYLFVNYMDAHQPYRRHETFAKAFKLPPPPPLDQQPRDSHELGVRFPAFTRDSYDTELAFVDEQLGRLMVDLRSRGMLDNTMVVITSDHGEGFGEHDIFEHSGIPYQTQVHVPLLVRRPGDQTQRVVGEPTSVAAVPGMILEQVGIEASALTPRVADRDPREVLSEVRCLDRLANGTPVVEVFRAIFAEDGRKVIQPHAGQPMVFNLPTDPAERDDLSATQPETVAWAEAFWPAWEAAALQLRQLTGTEVYAAKSAQDNLRAIGYLGGN